MVDNTTRSERSRKAAIQAALAILSRDGPGQLTFDAIARESGISKGGLMHQFPNKGAVLKALLEHQIEHFDKFTRGYLAAIGEDRPQAHLAAQIATLRESITTPHSVAFAILAALIEDPELLALNRQMEADAIERIRAEATDPDLSLLRMEAAKGLALSALFGLSALSVQERDRLFERLLDDHQWPDAPDAKKPRAARPARKPARSGQSH
ncbi:MULTISPECIES: TetR/AcrR family transcriptional regulator [Ralstonia solanacearum species complex]|uniref:TetR/AcrR family transcriptional regulator n=5 Tax=Ralstonia solanacearum species complex TaxID=3116862 RepID=A0A454TQX8_9RALS|nr:MULTISPECIES: TetR/AcrR family transcriptional regulator [Ralstonia]AKZ25699.1 transcriptional regulator [Ralstonia solanacearum]APC69381.1 TetR/AcrR family transcriptional regulator [Ralstonia solanacearum OE1-1]API73864.1 transcriptional regulator [Ralstonia pseudosolanacearum]ASL74104.1 transcriptional regulator [Ralstonia pseudosolanacearum]AST85703.1 TetR/AcrR family transcriptional regulator [Ralstonia pseudosolanacearum]